MFYNETDYKENEIQISKRIPYDFLLYWQRYYLNVYEGNNGSRQKPTPMQQLLFLFHHCLVFVAVSGGGTS